MEHKVFEYRAPHALLILKYVEENEGCTVAEVKQHLGIPLRLPSVLLPIQPANRVAIEIAIQQFKGLAMNNLIETDQNPKSIWGVRIKDSSCLYTTSQGQEVLRAYGRRLIQLLKFIQEKWACSIKDINVYWKQLCSKATVLDPDHDQLGPMEASGLVQPDGPLYKDKTIVKLTERGIVALKDEPENVLRLLYG